MKGKKLCEKLETEPQNKLGAHNGHNPDIIGSQRKIPKTELGKKTEIPTVEIPKEPIYVSDSPQKDKVSNVADEMTKSQDRDHFLAIPPIKHNPPEPIHDITPQEQRD